jgi:hypothetical protein
MGTMSESKFIEDQIRIAVGNILEGLIRVVVAAGVPRDQITDEYISQTVASFCIEDEALCDAAADALRADGWQVAKMRLYGKLGLGIC